MGFVWSAGRDDRKSVSIRVIRGICVLSFFDGSVLFRLVVAWGSYRAPGTVKCVLSYPVDPVNHV